MRSLEEADNKVWLGPPPDSSKPFKAALWLLLGVLSVLFFLFAIAYRMRMMLGDWLVLEDPWQLWINTTMLVLSSLAFEVARQRSKQSENGVTRIAWLLGLVAALGFVIGQLWVWQLLVAQGYYLASNPANSFFYLLTGLHGAHIIVGLAISFYCIPMILTRQKDSKTQIRINLCTTYWHYLVVGWVAIFALLTAT